MQNGCMGEAVRYGAGSVKADLTAYAQSLGFDLCRIAPAARPPPAAELRTWLEAGCQGEMSWLERNADRRTDPQLVQPSAKSIIVLGLNYYQEDPADSDASENSPSIRGESAAPFPGQDRGGRRGRGGRIARYAWGDDYHNWIEAQLRLLEQWLIERGGVQRRYVDTGPVLERDFAALAGVGWQGK